MELKENKTVIKNPGNGHYAVLRAVTNPARF